MKQVTLIIDDEVFDLEDLGQQQLCSSHLRSDICTRYCDLVCRCGKFLYNAAVPCLLGEVTPDEGSGFYFKKRRRFDGIIKKQNMI